MATNTTTQIITHPEYTQEDFAKVFHMLSALSNQIVHIDFIQVENWLNAIFAAQATQNDDVKQHLERLHEIMAAYAQTKAVIAKNGIPTFPEPRRQNEPNG
jgi:hypothetical protein